MSESYTLVLNSSVATNRTDNTDGLNGPYDLTYYVNWGKFLPDKYTKYNVICSLKTTATATLINLTAQIRLYLGSGNNYDQTQSQTQSIAFNGPNTFVTTTANAPLYYNETNFFSSNSVTINYPRYDYLRVQITAVAGTVPPSFNPYMLRIKFTPIKE